MGGESDFEFHLDVYDQCAHRCSNPQFGQGLTASAQIFAERLEKEIRAN